MTAQVAKLHIADLVAKPSCTIHTILQEYNICSDDVAMVYLSQDPYHDSFTETLDLQKFDSNRTPTSGMHFLVADDRVLLQSIDESTPTARIHNWWSCIHHAWLVQINRKSVTMVKDVLQKIQAAESADMCDSKLLFSHPQIAHGLTNDKIPQVIPDQLNNKHLLRPSLLNLEE